jgi:glycosyltransferase involved in cell wall biosynthesis
MSPPKLSIIIANYNYSAFLEACIESALSQTYPNVEVVIVDDGSTDGSAEVAKRFAGRAEVILREHAGETASRNAGFARSTGSIITFLDADELSQARCGRNRHTPLAIRVCKSAVPPAGRG